jgi:hypothetical protein
MANAIKVLGSWIDQASKRGTNTMYTPNGLTLAQYIEGLQAMAILLDNCSGAVLEGLNFTVPVDISGLTGNAALSTSDVEEVSQFVFQTTDGRLVHVNVPGLDDTKTPVGTDDLDQVDTDVAAFISMFEDGLATAGGTITPCDVDEDDIVAVVTARGAVRNSGKSS